MRPGHDPFGLGSEFPTVAALLTLRCNQHCPHCFVTQHPDKYASEGPAELAGEAWIGFFEKLRSPHRVILTGGEPTLHPDFQDIVRGIPDRHPRIVATNLTANTAVFEEALASGAALLAGFHEHLSEGHRKRFIRDVRRLSRRGPVAVQYIAHLDDAGDGIDVARRLRKARVRFQLVPIIDMDATGFRNINRRPLIAGRGRDYYIDPAYAADLARAAGGNAHIDTSAIDRIAGHPEFFHSDRARRARCDILTRHAVVNPAGEIFACRMPVGNVTRDDLEALAVPRICAEYGRCAELCIDPAELNIDVLD